MRGSLLHKKQIVTVIFCIVFFIIPAQANAIVENVPFKSQVPPGSWSNTLNCGQTSVVMMLAFLGKTEATTEQIIKIDDWLYETYGDPINNYSGTVTDIGKLTQIAIEVGGYSDSYDGHGDLDWLRSMFDSGSPVILATHIDMDIGKKGHFMLGLGIDGDEIIVHDPGKTYGAERRFSLTQFLQSWKLQGNAYTVVADGAQSEGDQDSLEPVLPFVENVPQNTSFFQKVKNFFSNIFQTDNNTSNSDQSSDVLGEQIETEIAPEEQETKVYDAVFLPVSQTVRILEGQKEASVTLQIKNTGNTVWSAGNISLNVVGGAAGSTGWYHPSWKTSLRPVVLSPRVEPGETGVVTFVLSKKDVSSPFRVQLVRQAGSQFIQVGTSIASISFEENVEVVEEVPLDTENIPAEEKKKNIFDTVKDITEVLGDKLFDNAKKLFDAVPKFFSGGSSSPAPAEDVVTAITPTIAVEQSVYAVATTTVVIGGIKNAVTERIDSTASSTVVSFPSSTAWQAELSLEEGVHAMSFTPRDASLNEGERVDVGVVVDLSPPHITQFSADSSFPTSTDIVLSWSAEDELSGVASVDIDVALDGGEWQSATSSIATTTYVFAGEQSHEYTFRIRAVDMVGNLSAWQEQSESVMLDWNKTLVINEIAWGGTAPAPQPIKKCPDHEWFELQNTSNSTIDVSGWKLLVRDISGTTKEIPLVGSVVPGQYILLARNIRGQDALASLPIHQLYEDVSLDNSGMELQLVDQDGYIVDEVSFLGGWPAGEPGKAMERVSTRVSGNRASNWQTRTFESARGRTNACGTLYGTPLQPNGAFRLLQHLPTEYADMIDEDGVLTLTTEHSPYVMVGNTTVPADMTLVVEPGVVIIGKNNDAMLDVYGTVRFLGTEENPIRITSARDVSDGSWYMDSIGQGDPQGGDWSRIHVHQGAVLDMTYTELLYGGNWFSFGGGFVFGAKHYSQLIYNEGDTRLSHVQFRSPYIETNATYQPFNAMIWTTTGTVRISDSVFDGGGMAFSNQNMTTADITVERSVFSHFVSPSGVFVLTYAWPELRDNTFVSNAGPELVVSSYTFTKDTTIPAHSSVVTSNITIPEDVTLDIEEGVVLRVRQFGEINVYGTLNTHGTEASPVFIQSGGDYWRRLSFYSGSQGNIVHTTISGGGRSSADRKTIMVDVQAADVVFDHSNILDARQPTDILIRLQGSRVSFTNGQIGYTGALSGKYGIDVSGGETLLNDMLFTNFTRALVGNTNTTVLASNMSTANFVGITDKYWVPPTLVQFVSELVPIVEDVPPQSFVFAPLRIENDESMTTSTEEHDESFPKEDPVLLPKEELFDIEEELEEDEEDDEAKEVIETIESAEDVVEEVGEEVGDVEEEGMVEERESLFVEDSVLEEGEEEVVIEESEDDLSTDMSDSDVSSALPLENTETVTDVTAL